MCTKCKEIKPLTEFYKEKRRPVGFQSICKKCHSLRSKQYYKDNIVKFKEYNSEYYQNNKSKFPDYVKDWRSRNAEKVRECNRLNQRKWRLFNKYKEDAHNAVKKALRAKILVALPCEICGSLEVEAHHDDYSKPLDVRWLCRVHHLAIHNQKYEPCTSTYNISYVK